MTHRLSAKNKDKVTVPLKDRPICTTAGCNNKTQHMGIYYVNGYPKFRKYCTPCHTDRRANFQVKSALVDRRTLHCCKVTTCKKKVEISGTNHSGKIKYTIYCKEHSSALTGHLAFRKSYCENIDGRLEFKCTTTIIWEGMLDVDHINGDPFDSRTENLQTLCKCCHAVKSNINRDYATPGRKQTKYKLK
jgi:hypothetical protein